MAKKPPDTNQTVNPTAFRDWGCLQLTEIRAATLREISALLVHDISTPLHVIKFVRQRLRTPLDPATLDEYLNRLTSSVDSVIDTLDTGRAYLQSGELREVTESTLGDIWMFVNRLIRARFYHKKVERLSLSVDPEAASMTIEMPMCDSIFVIHQIVMAEIPSLLDSSAATLPFRLTTPQQSATDPFITFDIVTPSTRMTPDALQLLRELPPAAEVENPTARDIGIRLAVWMIEQTGGRVEIVRNPDTTVSWRVTVPGYK